MEHFPFAQAQTPQQRRANLKFAKQNEAKMGKSEEEVKKMVKKETAKAPISPIWLGMRAPPPLPLKPLSPTLFPTIYLTRARADMFTDLRCDL